MDTTFILNPLLRAANFIGRISARLGFSPHFRTVDREILEQQILPYFAQSPDYMHILFVGSEWYTKDYEKIFTGKDYWTLDNDPKKQIYGSSQQHIYVGMQNIDRYFSNNSLDLIICNGVLGWGLNKQAEIEAAFTHCYNCLREKGILVIGWNDIAKKNHLPLENYKSLQKFRRYDFPPLAKSTYYTNSLTAHVYNFYIK